MDEVVTLNYGKALTSKMRRPGNVPVYGTNGRTGWHDARLGEGPTVILGRKGMGNLGVKWCSGPFWVIDTAYYTTFDNKRLAPEFFYYFTDYVGLNHLKDGTSNPSLTRDTFGRQYMPLPPLPEQRCIAAVLSALDDKIDLNRRMNRTLEELAQAIFKSWFIDFDGHTDLVESELGLIPKGWEVSRIDDHVTLAKGLSYRSEFFAEDGLPLANLKCIAPGGGFQQEGLKAYAGEHDDRHVVAPGDIVIAMTDLTQKRVVIGCPAVIPRLKDHDRILMSLDLCSPRLKATSPLTLTWLHRRLKTEDFRAFALGFTNGTTVLHLKADGIRRFKFPLPPRPLVESFTEAVRGLNLRAALNDDESKTLAAIRDALLPKLISGEIRVPEAAQVIMEAT